MLTTNQSYATYLGNGATTLFPFGFIVSAASNLVVSITNNNVNPPVTTILSPSQYTATGFGLETGGSVSYPVSGNPLPSGWSITIQRIVPYQQSTSLTNQGAFYPQVVEACLDNLTMQTQQLSAQIAGAAPVVGNDLSVVDTATHNTCQIICTNDVLGLTGGNTIYFQPSLGYISVVQYGAKADSGTTDNTAAFQAALNAAPIGGIVFIPPSGTGYYGFASTGSLTIPSGVSLVGASTSQSYDPINAVPQGSVLGITNTVSQFITIGSNNRIEGLTFHYPNQTSTGTPTIYPPTIGQPSTGTITNFTLRNCVAFNPYDFLKMNTLWPTMDLRISDISGDFIHYGFQIDNQDNLVWVRNIYDKAFSSNSAYLTWRRANSILFVLGSMGIWADRLFTCSKFASFEFNQGGSSGSGNVAGPGGYINDITQDDSTNGMIFNSASTFGLTISNYECALTQSGCGMLFGGQLASVAGGANIFIHNLTLWGTYTYGILNSTAGNINVYDSAILGTAVDADTSFSNCNVYMSNVQTTNVDGYGSDMTGFKWLGGKKANATLNYVAITNSNQGQFMVRDVTGLNPAGTIGPPSMPASTVNQCNPYPFMCRAYISGGMVTAIVINGVATGLTSGAFDVGPGENIAIQYSSAPTWAWNGV